VRWIGLLTRLPFASNKLRSDSDYDYGRRHELFDEQKKAAGLRQITYEEASVETFSSQEPFDLVIGRYCRKRMIHFNRANIDFISVETTIAAAGSKTIGF
jgi:hypothetical protein